MEMIWEIIGCQLVTSSVQIVDFGVFDSVCDSPDCFAEVGGVGGGDVLGLGEEALNYVCFSDVEGLNYCS